MVTVEDDTETTLILDTSDGLVTGIVTVVDQNGAPIKGAEISGVCNLYYSGGDSFVETESASGSDGIVSVHAGVTPTSCTRT